MTKILHIPTGIILIIEINNFTKQTLIDLFETPTDKLFNSENIFFAVRRLIDVLEDTKIYIPEDCNSYYTDVRDIRDVLNIVEFEVLDD